MPDKLSILIADEDQDSRVETRKAVQRAQLAVAGEAGYGRVAVTVALETRPDIILLAVEEPVGRPLETAEALGNALPETPLIVYSSLNDAESIRRCMVMGARDYMLKPVQAARLSDAVNTVLLQEERRKLRSAGQLMHAAARATVIAVTGAKGGIGKTVISVNLALALRREGHSVVIVDADTDFGDVATMMDLAPALTIADLLPALGRVDRESMRGYLTPHGTGVDVLAAPPDGATWERFGSDDLKQVIELLAQTYDFVVIDTSGSFDATVRACVEVATLTLMVTSGEVSSIRDTASALRRLSTWEVDGDRLKVLLNRGSRVNGFRMEDLKETFGQDIFWQVPADRAVPQSVQVGQPVMLEGTSAAAQNLADLARRIVGTKRSAAEPVAAKPASFWNRLLSIRRG